MKQIVYLDLNTLKAEKFNLTIDDVKTAVHARDFAAAIGMLPSDIKPTDAVVLDDHFICVIGFASRDLHRASVLFHADAVLDGIFDQRLDRQQGDFKICRLYIVLDIQLIVKAQLFNI